MKRIIILGAVVLLVIAVWTGAWFWAAGQATGYVKSLETADGQTTPRLVCGGLDMGGYPFGFDLTCSDATITLADTTVTINGIKASAEVYNPTHVLVFAQSPVTFADAFTGSQSRLDFASASASARLTGWRIARVSLVVDKPVWNDTVLEDRLIASADQLQAHLTDVPDQHDATAGLATLAEYAEITGLAAPGFDVAAGKATFSGQISKLPDDVRTYGDADLLQRWQAAGGKFALTGFEGEDPGAPQPTKFAASGTLGLDSQGRAEGQLKLNSTGMVERVQASVPEQLKGLILGGQAADGSYSQTLNIAAGVVFVGLVPTAMIPALY